MSPIVASILSFFQGEKRCRLCLVCVSFVVIILFCVYISWPSSSSYHHNHFLNSYNMNDPQKHPNLLHMISISTVPLRGPTLAAIDSIARHMPHLTILMHITQEEGIPSTILVKRMAVIDAQLKVFQSKGVKINRVLYSNIESVVADTPLERLHLQQRHIGGLYGVEAHGFFHAHASDLLRLLVLFKYGGIYADYNYFLVADMQPLFDYYGPNILQYGAPDTFPNEEFCARPGIETSWIALEARHPFMEMFLKHTAAVINQEGIDRVFPWKADLGASVWLVISNLIAEKVHKELCRGSHPPLLVSEIPSLLQPQNAHSATYLDTNNRVDVTKTPYVVISSNYLNVLRGADINGVPVSSWLFDINTAALDSPDKLSTFNQIIQMLDSCFQVQLYGKAKGQWLEPLERNQYPLIKYIHEKSCKHLCDLKEFRRVVDLGKTITAS